MLTGASCADGTAAAARRGSPARVKSVSAGRQTVDRGVGPTPAPSPRGDHQLPLYLGAVPPYLCDARHAAAAAAAGLVKVDPSLGQSVLLNCCSLPSLPREGVVVLSVTK